MPLYEYRCQSCERVMEVMQSFSDKPPRKCPTCGGKLEKLVSRSGFILKGSGWYASDYKPAAKTSEAPSDDGGAKDDVKPASTPEPAEKPAKTPKKREKSRAPAD